MECLGLFLESLWTSVRTVSFMQRLRRRQIHTEGFIARQWQSILKLVRSNDGLTSKLGREFDCGGQRGTELAHATPIGEIGFLDFLNRSDDCRRPYGAQKFRSPAGSFAS